MLKKIIWTSKQCAKHRFGLLAETHSTCELRSKNRTEILVCGGHSKTGPLEIMTSEARFSNVSSFWVSQIGIILFT